MLQTKDALLIMWVGLKSLSAGGAYSAAYGYDAFGRFHSVSSSVPPASLAVQYARLPGSDLVSGYTVGPLTVTKTYEPRRDLIAAVSNHVNPVNPVLISAYDYANDAAGRRVSRNSDSFGYNARSEVTSAAIGTNSYGYAYDAIGNRVWSAANTLTNTYAANCLNQYTQISVPFVSSVVNPTYDTDGNMRWDGRFVHAWDAENRLVCSEPGLGGATNGSVRVVNSYDYQHRRHSKTVRRLTGRGAGYPFDPSQPGTWDVVETRTFIYDGWNLTAEVVVDAQAGTTNVTRYLWGPDLSGTLQGAGGVGGLLAVIRSDGTFFPCYDANGNVTGYVDANGTVRGHFEYDTFGNTIAVWGDLADTFRFRFSTKYWDAETRSYYYGYRHYAPKLGCWFNRDPIGERGGLNLYCVLGNNLENKIDKLGLKECECAQERIWIELGNKMHEASQLTLDHPVIVDLNYDKAVSKIPMFGPVYREYGGYICCNKENGVVSSTGPYPGSWRYRRNDGTDFYSDDPVLLARGGGTPTTGNITEDEKKRCPVGTTTVVFYHSHPPSSPNLSPSDEGFSNSSGFPIAGGGSGGNYYWLYSPSFGWILVGY